LSRLTIVHRWISLGNQVAGLKPQPRSGHTLSAYGKNLVLLGGRSGSNIWNVDQSVFVLDTSQLTMPSDVESPQRVATERNVSFRSVVSEPISLATESTSPITSTGFVLDASQLTMPSDVESPQRVATERNISFRSVVSEPIRLVTESTSPITSTGSLLLDYDEEPSQSRTFESNFENLPAEGFYNTDLLEFLQNQCDVLSPRLKIKFQSDPIRHPHWTAGNDSNVLCQRRIDSGATGDVYQVNFQAV
jgi:hypothetical protein